MKKVFWDNPYQTELDTTVIAINGSEVLFASTIAYSFAGGQESDKAWVNDIPIVGSRREENLIYYTFAEGHGFKVGDAVKMVIDWPRRYRLMRLHFAAELILEIVTRNFNFPKIGAHIAEHKARIDFVAENNISSLLSQILAEYNAIIAADMIIHKDYSNVATEIRFWKIDGFAQVPCGGTHVKSTAEVGFVQLKREHPGKSIERIEIRLVDPM